MQVFKFGGASVKDAPAVQNVGRIIQLFQGEPLLVVVSAMGKTTNALERLTYAYVHRQDDCTNIFEEIKNYHFDLAKELMADKATSLLDDLSNTFVEIDWILEEEPQEDYSYIYDQIVSIGEIASTKIVSAYLQHAGILNQWIDARGYIQTDNSYRQGTVDWTKTEQLCQSKLKAIVEKQTVITQGFIGGTSENYTTTLGREGSDYSAAIFASCLAAKAVTIWKDVPGVLNADPKKFQDTVLFDQLPYSEAIEMTYYGASVIHPKTIKPLQNRNIPLYVRPFGSPEQSGTVIGNYEGVTYSKPVIIHKDQQVLLSISTHDLSFIAEESLSQIFQLVAQQQVKINLMQNSALSFSICVDLDAYKTPALIQALQAHFKVKYNENLQLLTLRHYTESFAAEIIQGKEVLLEQRSRNTFQVVIK